MKKIEVFFEEEELKELADKVKKLSERLGFKVSRSQYIRVAVIERMKKESEN